MIFSDLVKVTLYTLGFAPRKAIRGFVSQVTEERLSQIQVLFTSIARKAIIAFLALHLNGLIQSGLIKQGDCETIADLVLSLFGIGIISIWSKVLVPLWINKVMPWLNAKR